MSWTRYALGTLLVSCVLLQEKATASAHHSVRIPRSTIVLGSNLEEIVAATEHCTRYVGAPCAVEDYSAELSSGKAVTIDSFFMDRFEVSQAAYQRCVLSGQCDPPEEELLIARLRGPNFPVVLVTQNDAMNYCDFIGGALPSEAHFEAAAAGQSSRQYPWGDVFHRKLSNFGSRSSPFTASSDGFELLAPVERYVAGSSPQGVQQLAGNVAEWTSTPYVPHEDQAKNTPKPTVDVVVKGGGFLSIPTDQRSRSRRGMAKTDVAVDVGFRCIRPTIVNR